MISQNFGALPFGEGVYGGEILYPELETPAARILQRYPTGLAFSGRYIHALESAFVAEFNHLRGRASQAINTGFWKNQAAQESGNLSISYIEKQLNDAGFGNVRLFHTTGLRHYVQPMRSAFTYHGHGVFGEGHSSDAGALAFKAQFGDNDRAHTDPREYPHGKEIYIRNAETGQDEYIGAIDHLLDGADGKSQRTQTVFSQFGRSLLQRTFVYYACGGEEFMQTAITATSEEIAEIKKILLRNVQFGLFGILLFSQKELK